MPEPISVLSLLSVAVGGLGNLVSVGSMGSGAARAVRDRLPHTFTPKNHDFLLGLRTAQLQAVRTTVERWVASEESAAERETHEARAFVRDARRFLRPKLIAELGIQAEKLLQTAGRSFDTLEDLAPLVQPALAGDGASGSPSPEESATGPGPPPAARRRGGEPAQVAAARATLEELRFAVAQERGVVLPSAVVVPGTLRHRFLDPADDGEGWWAWFCLFVGEQLKGNEAFRAVFFAHEFREIKGALDAWLGELDRKLEPTLRARAELERDSAALARDLGAFREAQEQTSATMIRLLEGLDERLGEVSTAMAALEGAVRAGLSPAPAPERPFSLWRPDAEHGGAADGPGDSADSLVYSRELDAFRGRAESRRRVEDELLADDPAHDFLFTVVHGPAGTGKSRFALQVLKAAEARYPSNGFIERRAEGVEESLVPSRRSFEGWTPREPTLVVVDYCARYPNLVEFLHLLRLAARRGGVPVRVLLLERYLEGELETRLAGAGAEDRWLRTHRRPRAVALGDDPLSDDDVFEIIVGRLEDEQRAEAKDRRDLILRRLRDLDPERRPLFAAILGDALARGVDLDGDPEDFQLELFRARLGREETQWFRRPAGHAHDDGPRRSRHLNLLALSTLCQGLTGGQIRSIQALGEDRLPPLPSPPCPSGSIALDPALFARMTGRSEKGRTGFMEPDLLGELFVLDRLTRLRGDPFRQLEHDALLDAAWDIAPQSVGTFTRQAFQDYPRLVADLDYLHPSDPALGEPWLPVARTLIHDCRARCASASGDDLDELAGHAEALLGRMKEIAATRSLGPEHLGHLAAAARYRLELEAARVSPEIQGAIGFGSVRPAEIFATHGLRRNPLSREHGRVSRDGDGA